MPKEKTAKTIANVVVGKWDSNQLAVITHLANPRGGTQRDLAVKIGIHETTISDWKRLEGFMEDVHRVAAVYFLEADLQVDRANLRDCLRDPTDYPMLANAILKARELYYKRRGLLIEVNRFTGAAGGPVEIIVNVEPPTNK